MIHAIEPQALNQAQLEALDQHTRSTLQVVDLYELEQLSYRQGWRWGVFCGGVVTLTLALAGAVLLGVLV